MKIRSYIFSGLGFAILLLIGLAFIASGDDSGNNDAASADMGAAENAKASAAEVERDHVPPGLSYNPASDGAGTLRQPMIATALNAAPGAIVCPDFQSVEILFDVYSESWEERASNAFTHGAYQKINGEPLPAPDPAAYSCLVLKPGTRVMLSTGAGAPDIVATLPAGNRIRGVTLPAMLTAPISAEQMAPGSLALQVRDPSADLVRQWSMANAWAQSRCGWDTEAMVEACLDQQARIWKGIHPDTVAVPWAEASQ